MNPKKPIQKKKSKETSVKADSNPSCHICTKVAPMMLAIATTFNAE